MEINVPEKSKRRALGWINNEYTLLVYTVYSDQEYKAMVARKW